MRILFVVDAFPPDLVGGTGLYASELARILWRRGHDIVVIARDVRQGAAVGDVRREQHGQIPVVRVNNPSAESGGFGDTYRGAAVESPVRALLDYEPPDIVHVHDFAGVGTAIVDECAARGIPTVVTLHDYWLICHRGHLLDVELVRCEGPSPARCAVCAGLGASERQATGRAARWLRALDGRVPNAFEDARRRFATHLAHRAVPESAIAEAGARIEHMRSVCERATRLLAPSDTLLEEFVRFGVPRGRLRRVELGINPRPFVRLNRQKSDRLRIGFVGGIRPPKAPHLLIEAVEGLPQRRVVLTVAGSLESRHGDVEYVSRLRQLLRSNGVQWLNGVAHEKVPSVFEGLDVLVVPSVSLENSPRVVKEAFAAGLPVVASDVGGLAELVADGRSGLLFRVGDSADLRRALQRLLDEPDLLGRLREGIPRVKTIDEDAAGTSALYQEVWLERHGRPAPANHEWSPERV